MDQNLWPKLARGQKRLEENPTRAKKKWPDPALLHIRIFFLDKDGDVENVCANAGLPYDAAPTQVCEENSHVNNLKGSKSNKVDGWTIDKTITEGSWNHDFIFKGQTFKIWIHVLDFRFPSC